MSIEVIAGIFIPLFIIGVSAGYYFSCHVRDTWHIPDKCPKCGARRSDLEMY